MTVKYFVIHTVDPIVKAFIASTFVMDIASNFTITTFTKATFNNQILFFN